MVAERISALREEMRRRGIDVYYIPTSDFHETEYVGEYFKAREYITGFTGSAGVAVITMQEAGLWTDGRYFIQAEKQLRDTPVTLFRMGEEGVPKVRDYMLEKVPENGCIGFDGRVVNAEHGLGWMKAAEEKHVRFHTDEDLIDLIWKDRPAMSAEPVYVLEEAYTGCSTGKKLELIREDMEKAGADIHVLSTLDNICWLLNIRGNDVSHFPVVLSYAVVEREQVLLFLNPDTVSEEVEQILQKDQVHIRPYNDIFSYLEQVPEGCRVLLDTQKVNLRLYQSIPSHAVVVDEANPEVIRQAIKNEVELQNIREAHVRDGIACTRFMYWLKTNIGKIPMTELSASDHLEELRREQEGFLDLSFDTICAYEANAAMMHYEATPESYSVLEPKGFLLVDSGGHYLQGSTDITRTFVLGPLTEEQKKMFTIVLRSNLNLGSAKFQYGCRGLNLDILARGPLWEMGLDYRCGTGHGIGYILNVHEAPNGFRWRVSEERNDSCVLEEGMVTTNEPGYYEEGAYGIRTENEMICRKGPKTEYGQFMEFETITYCPIDLDAVDARYLNETDKERLNAYHKTVYEVIAPYLNEDEREWLKNSTRAI